MVLTEAFFFELPWGPVGLVIAAAIAGAFFGLFMAIVFRAQARKRRLPLWRDYHGN
jgi:membrane associated rhomboid family serine protease